jgi:hypothetical protein
VWLTFVAPISSACTPWCDTLHSRVLHAAAARLARGVQASCAVGAVFGHTCNRSCRPICHVLSAHTDCRCGACHTYLLVRAISAGRTLFHRSPLEDSHVACTALFWVRAGPRRWSLLVKSAMCLQVQCGQSLQDGVSQRLLLWQLLLSLLCVQLSGSQCSPVELMCAVAARYTHILCRRA